MNYLTCTFLDESLQAGIFANCDVKLKGYGYLNITSSILGIDVKDDLKIQNLTLEVTSNLTAIKANDSIEVVSGNLKLISETNDGLKTSNTSYSTNLKQKGNINILGGSLEIYACCDGIDASYDTIISDGTVNIYTDTFSPYTKEKTAQGSTMYISISSPMNRNNYTYSAYFYNNEGNSELCVGKKIEPTQGMGGRPGGQQNVYYSFTKPSFATNVVIYAYNSNQNANSIENYVAKTDDDTTIPANFNTLKLSSISTSSKIINVNGWSNYTQNSTKLYSSKGIKADNKLMIQGGNINIHSVDDALHTSGDVIMESTSAYGEGIIEISNGIINIETNDDGIHADNDIYIIDGEINISKSYEGIEANRIYIQGGNTSLYASDDGLNAANGNNRPYIEISGGYVEARVPSGDTDTVDSNGDIKISGGFVVLKNENTRATSSTGGTIDLDGSLSVIGGTVISVGQREETISNAKLSTANQAQGVYKVKDGDETLFSYELEKSYVGYMIYSSLFTKSSYDLYRDDVKIGNI